MNGTMFTEKHVALKHRNSMTLLNLVKKNYATSQQNKEKCRLKKKKKQISGYQRWTGWSGGMQDEVGQLHNDG